MRRTLQPVPPLIFVDLDVVGRVKLSPDEGPPWPEEVAVCELVEHDSLKAAHPSTMTAISLAFILRHPPHYRRSPWAGRLRNEKRPLAQGVCWQTLEIVIREDMNDGRRASAGIAN